MENETEIIVKKLAHNGSRTNLTSSGRKSCSSASTSGRSRRPRETEEEATIRRFHDAQRMARFRARKKKALEDQLQLQLQKQQQLQQLQQNETDAEKNITEWPVEVIISSPETESKYTQLLAIIERLGKDVRLSYAGSRSSAERLKSGISRARTLVRDCLIETRLNLRQ